MSGALPLAAARHGGQTRRLRLPTALRRVAGISIAALGCVLALQGDPAAAGPRNVPLKASVTTAEVLSMAPDRCAAAPYLLGTTTGTGNASHLGKITFKASDCTVPTGPTSFNFSNGELVITAANGDQLLASYGGQLGFAAPNTLTGEFTITGGTGRFVGASGSGYLGGTQDIATFKGAIELTGTLSY